ncbi:hypothetical protein MOC78_03380 [Bacillus inaquosorum]|uniref:hypothetical protein n=1 Tax=Bacillus TaxID=1386 RepID=UPI0012FD241A|nr:MULTISPECIES: hypothetical protein [Bacillus]MCY8386520.1 hypothetical protein [Bacillus inaquosorum]MED0799352.1 hypothetical protein [Bacillus inaquosorum]
MEKYFVMYNSTDVIWCYEEEAFEKLTAGWTIHAISYDEKSADKLVEEACYL